MKYLNTIQKSKEIDSNLINDYGLSSITLMENASRGVFDELAKVFPSLENIKILIICGKGNNGGDGFALARHCIIANMNVDCIM
ncbi:MAG: NAD(P)H-hydrate epimerase, partial [Candidatus Kapaibacterium sp.]